LEYFALEGSFVNQYRSTPRCIHYRGVSTITNSNNSSNIRKNSKSFLGMSNGTRRRCLMKKTRAKKSRDTVPLNTYTVQCRMLSFILPIIGFWYHFTVPHVAYPSETWQYSFIFLNRILYALLHIRHRSFDYAAETILLAD
jgi:hypothetical protein